MNSTGSDWAVAMSVGAVLLGIVGELAAAPAFTVAAFVLFFAAIGAIMSDSVSSQKVLAVSGVVVGITGLGAALIGAVIGSGLLTFGGLSVGVVATVVTIAEMWRTT